MEVLRRYRGRVLVLGVVALAAVALAIPALAQDSGATTAPDEATTETMPWSDRFEERRTVFVEALAEELGMSVDEVDNALTAVRERLAEEHRERHLTALRERLDDAVASGALTQEQADAIADAAEAGVLGRGHRDGRGGFGHHGPRGWFGGPGMPFDGAGADASSGDPA